MDGMEEYQFSPNTALTRAQAAQILYNLEGQPTPTQGSCFPDVIGHWATSAIAWAAQNGEMCIRDSIRPLVEAYCAHFGGDADALLQSDYFLLSPNSQSPYKQLYVNN